jgi:tungstate transport system substrate-binding protein
VDLTRQILAALLCLSFTAQAQQKYITVASTTSTEQSGLFKHLLPEFEKKTGIQVRVVALGTGQAIDMGKRGDADVAFVHDRAAEEKAVAEGAYVDRREVMYNDFIIVGPKSDPAKAKGSDVVAGLKRIAQAKAPFASRGDKSGTHSAELRLWKQAGVDPQQGKGSWYRETGSGMGPTLNTASGMNAYALTDRGTWLSFKNRGELGILVEGDRRLFNQYGVMLVNPAKHPHVKKAEGMAFINWVTSPEGQKAIADYKIGGEQLFFPNAEK